MNRPLLHTGALVLAPDGQHGNQQQIMALVRKMNHVLYNYPINHQNPGGSIFNNQHKNSPFIFSGSNRISLKPRNIFTNRRGVPISNGNSDNHFRFEQNLRQGAALCQEIPRAVPSHSDTVAQLANAMLLRQPLPRLKNHHPSVKSHDMNTGQINVEDQLQIQSQQVPGSFTLGKISSSK